MANEVKFTITGDSDKAIAEQQKVIKKQDEMIEKLKKGGVVSRRRAAESQQQFSKIKRIGGQLLSVFGPTIGIAGALSAIVSTTKEWYAGLDKLAKVAHTASMEYIALAQLSKEGQARQDVIQAAQLGAASGVTPGAAYSIVQAAKSQGSGITGAKAVFGLMQAGASLESAQAAVFGGYAAGIEPGLAARYPYAAGAASVKDMPVLIKAAPAYPFFEKAKGGPGAMWPVATTLSAVVPEKLEVHTRAAGKALLMPAEGKWRDYLSTLPGFKEKDIGGILGSLRAEGIVSAEDVQKMGLGDIRGQLAVSILLKNYEPFLEKTAEIERAVARPGLLLEKREIGEYAFPEAVAGRIAKERLAKFLAEQQVPTTPEGWATMRTAMERNVSRRARGQAMLEVGLGPVISGEEGQATWLDWYFDRNIREDLVFDKSRPWKKRWFRPSSDRAQEIYAEDVAPLLKAINEMKAASERTAASIERMEQGQNFAPETQ